MGLAVLMVVVAVVTLVLVQQPWWPYVAVLFAPLAVLFSAPSL